MVEKNINPLYCYTGTVTVGVNEADPDVGEVSFFCEDVSEKAKFEVKNCIRSTLNLNSNNIFIPVGSKVVFHVERDSGELLRAYDLEILPPPKVERSLAPSPVKPANSIGRWNPDNRRIIHWGEN